MRWSHLLSFKLFIPNTMSRVYHTAPAMIGPSLLASDMSNLASESQLVIEAGADFLHLGIYQNALSFV